MGRKIRVQVHVDDWRSLLGRERWSVTQTDSDDGREAENQRSHNNLLLSGGFQLRWDSERWPGDARSVESDSHVSKRLLGASAHAIPSSLPIFSLVMF